MLPLFKEIVIKDRVDISLRSVTYFLLISCQKKSRGPHMFSNHFPAVRKLDKKNKNTVWNTVCLPGTEKGFIHLENSF